LTPSRALARGPMVPLYVTLVDGGVPLNLTFQPGKVDHALRILKRPLPNDARIEVPKTVFREALSSTAGVVFKDGACASLQSPRVRANEVLQARHVRTNTPALVCAVGTINYVRVRRTAPGCTVSSARLLRQGKDVEVLLLEQAQLDKGVSWQVLATWTLPGREDVELLLLAADGTRCEAQLVTLGPGDSP
jgi:hypothetical protein